ncbi:MAG: transcriptional repressor [Chlorobi bacterium]|nr:transcriptional repressor [Chlorobiota bacterium]
MTRQPSQSRKESSEKLVQAETLFKTYMKEHGMRCTTERLIVLRELYKASSHLDADEIFVRLKKKGMSISRATVYHTLDLLFKCHLVTKIDLGHKHTHYEKSHGVANHLHIICEQCGKVVEVTDEKLASLLETLCRNNGFALESFSLQVFGTCLAAADGTHCHEHATQPKTS